AKRSEENKEAAGVVSAGGFVFFSLLTRVRRPIRNGAPRNFMRRSLKIAGRGDVGAPCPVFVPGTGQNPRHYFAASHRRPLQPGQFVCLTNIARNVISRRPWSPPGKFTGAAIA